ncbi:MAG: Rrf2 family transcriptional regulator [Thermodesulfobacteriota bacterium]
MFRLSRGAEYAIRGILHLASEPEGKISFIEEIARAQDTPKAYLAKIFQALTKKGFLKSFRGPDGGFMLTRPAAEVSVLDIIEAMEGPVHLNECLIHKGYCARDTFCPIHDVWHEAQKRLMDFLASCSFADLAEAGRKKQEALLKNTANE